MLKIALLKIAHGFLVGVGFAAAIGMLIFSVEAWQARKYEQRAHETREEIANSYSGPREYSPEAGLKIKEHRPQKQDANSAFLGSIENTGSVEWRSVELLVELFDKDGVFVDKCTGSLDGSISPGQTRNFKVSCSECRDPSHPLVYDRYTIVIADAYTPHPEITPAH